MDDKLDHVDKTLLRNTLSLEEHIRRTEIIEKEMEPVKEHVAQVSGGIKFIFIMASVAAVAQAIIMIVKP